MNEIKLIIFDVDGTLVDAYPAIISSFNYVMQKLGLPKQPVLTIRSAVGWGDENLLAPFVPRESIGRAISLYRRHHAQALIKGSRVFPGVRGLLKHLKNKGYILAIASNRPSRFTRILIKHLGLDLYFDYVLCADKLKEGKPHPEILHRIVHKFKVSAKEALYVGDMTIDAQAGHRAGLRTIIVTTGSSLKNQIKKERPFKIISKVVDLVRILR